MSQDDKNIFDAIKQFRIIHTVIHSGIDVAVTKYDVEKPQVNEVVVKAIQDHHDVIKTHENSITTLQKCMQQQDQEKTEPKSSTSTNVLCYICGKNGHKAKDCCGVGCYRCGKVGHVGRITSRCNGDVFSGFVGHYSAICYYCGKGGYIAVCSKCGETGHVGKECS